MSLSIDNCSLQTRLYNKPNKCRSCPMIHVLLYFTIFTFAVATIHSRPPQVAPITKTQYNTLDISAATTNDEIERVSTHARAKYARKKKRRDHNERDNNSKGKTSRTQQKGQQVVVAFVVLLATRCFPFYCVLDVFLFDNSSSCTGQNTKYRLPLPFQRNQ